MTAPRVSVTMAVLDAAATIGVQLDALADQSYPGWWELVIADNGCTDGSMGIVDDARARFRSVRVVDASDRRGGAYAKNRAARAAEGDVILCCDADDVVDAGWIEALVDQLSVCDIAGGTADRTSLNSAVVNRWHWSMRGPTGTGLGGGNLGCWRTAWDALGGFDDRFYHADADLYLRATEAGFRVRVTPAARIKIRHRSTLRALMRRSFDAGRGRADLIARHPSFEGGRWKRWRRSIRNVTFVAVCWPAAVVSASARGLWLRLLMLEAGYVSARVRSTRRATLRRR